MEKEDDQKHSTEATRDIGEFLKEVDFFRDSEESLIKFINWLLAISVGFLLVLISNLERFLLNDKMFLKPIFIFMVISIGTSILLSGIVRFLYFLADIGVTTFSSSMKKLQWKATNNIGDRDKIMEALEKRIHGWVGSINLISGGFKLTIVKYASFTLFLGIIIVVGYFIALICIKY